MAKFWQVHKIRGPVDHLQIGDIYRVAILEPYAPGDVIPETIQLLSLKVVRLARDRKFSYATDADQKLVEDWEKRHEYTSPERFSVPDFMFPKGRAA